MARGRKPGCQKTGGRKPGSTNKVTRELKDLAREYTVEAVEALAHVMRNGKSEQARAIASDKLLDRGWGKATQPIAGDKNTDAIKFESTVNMTDVAKLLLVKLGETSS